MTTIAYCDGVLAGDTRITIGDLISPETATKVIKLPSGALLGMSGTWARCCALQRALENDHPLPDLKGVDAILISPDGRVYAYDRDAWNPIDTPYYALGTGADYAYVALWLGHDAVTAVKAGIKFDKNSGGKIKSVKLGTGKK